MQPNNPYYLPYTLSRKKNPWKRWLGASVGVIALAILVYNVPYVHDRLAWRLDSLRTSIVYFLHPPEEVTFLSGDSQDFSATASALALVPRVTSTAQPASPTPVPLPESTRLEGFTFVSQQGRWNYCGPSTLSMALNFWGWTGNRDDIAMVVKPGLDRPDMDFIERGKTDKNVMPYELVDYVNSDTNNEYRALSRIGGDLDLLKKLIANGFPVMIEKGYYEADYRGIVDWLGHYLLVTGYDDAKGAFIVQDSWDKNHPGENQDSPYDLFAEGWRSFNYIFMVIYPPDKEAEVLDLLGPWANEEWANTHAFEVANREKDELSGIDQYFAWFNLGSSHVALYEYVDAVNAYDWAFQLYNRLDDPNQKRPYRMMWYQTWPYWAYYYAGRYDRVIELANQTLSTVDEPTLEESLYWRGMAYKAINELGNAETDFREAVRLHPGFLPAIQALEQMGLSG